MLKIDRETNKIAPGILDKTDTNDYIGYWAAILLVLLRLMQGLSIGGELTGSVSFLTEMAPEEKRGYYGSWAFVGVFIGILLGSALGALITKVLSPDQVHAYGWRLPLRSGFLVEQLL